MKPISIQRVAEFCGGTLRGGDPARLVTRVSTDSRRVAEGDIFVALSGERFDAHDFIPQVAAAGVAAVIVSRTAPEWQSLPCAVIEVDHTLSGLQRLASRYRQWHRPLVVALSGSNGKTSTKDFTAAVMAARFQSRATIGNLNNHIGCPLTLLALEEGDECCVAEMGMNHAGEIKVLVDIARPDAGLLTNIGLAHIENLGTQDAIAWEKATLPANVRPGGVVVLNAGDAYTPVIARHCQADVFTAGIGAGHVAAHSLAADEGGTTFTLDFSGESVQTRLPVIGEHMVANAALAACMGWRHGISPAAIGDALRNVRLTGGRLEPKTIQGVHFIDDSYNANPDSMRAGLRTLASTGSGRRVAVLGRMGELGHLSDESHRDVGACAASLPLAAVFTVGGADAVRISDAAREARPSGWEVAHFDSHEACAAHLREWLHAGDTVLLKGSRSAAMEKVLTCFQTS